MSNNSNTKKNQQLGMNHGTASNRLKKNIMFSMLTRLGEATCFQCGEVITDVSTLSVEHKTPWLDSEDPLELFFDLDNIAFSHLTCNVGASRNPQKGVLKHPSKRCYNEGCRCDGCKEVKSIDMKRYRDRRVIREVLGVSTKDTEVCAIPSVNTYNRGCRCGVCTAYNSDYQRNRRANL